MAGKVFKMDKRPTGMDYKTYRATCAAKNMDPMEQDAWKALPVEGSDEDEGSVSDEGGEPSGADEGGESEESAAAGDDNGDEDIERSTEVGDLLKALDAAGSVTEAAAAADEGPGREDYLTERFRSGTITKSEQRELARIWAGDNADAAPEAPLRKSLTEIVDDEDARVIDASPILSALFNGLDESLGNVRTDIAKSAREGRALAETHLTLTKAMIPVIVKLEKSNSEQAAVIAALGERLNIIERQPQRRRSQVTKSRGQERPLAKSTHGGGSGNEAQAPVTGKLHKGQVVAGLNTLTKSARDNGDTQLAKRLVMATASYESTGILDSGFRSAVNALYT